MADEKKGLWEEFKEFAFKGNVLDLALAVVIGVAFKAIVDALVINIVMPFVAVFVGKKNFDNLHFTLHHSPIMYGAFITAVVNFLLMAASLFVFVKLVSHAMQLRKRPGAGPPETRDCPRCYSEISARASRCPQCTSDVEALAA